MVVIQLSMSDMNHMTTSDVEAGIKGHQRIVGSRRFETVRNCS